MLPFAGVAQFSIIAQKESGAFTVPLAKLGCVPIAKGVYLGERGQD